LAAELPVLLQELDITFHRAFDMSRDLRWEILEAESALSYPLWTVFLKA
jgi:copper homeostasis protein CutC